jgi:hypothetical protein
MGDRDRNVGRIDRVVRVPLGAAAVALAGWVYLTYPLATGIAAMLVLGVTALILLISATTGTCGIYGALGISTCEDPDCAEEGSETAWVAE